ncbi:hypothetical protein ACFE04_004591 [Oxalis oulophora]
MVLEVVEIPPSLATRANRKEDEDNGLVELSVNEGSPQEDHDTDEEKASLLHVRTSRTSEIPEKGLLLPANTSSQTQRCHYHSIRTVSGEELSIESKVPDRNS